ncbi:hypothetical protein NX059_011144 [Plenodomus lindquistii]|nr:hypothetical protein NX059_011144 [Plenodomus lindquistii]
MRLLNTKTLIVEQFLASNVPQYVILSHTWDEEEVTLSDMELGRANQKKGYSKIVECCKIAAADQYEYCWIDTCCIDKTSSAELSEAINSMYRWYEEAHACYAYLADFPQNTVERNVGDFTKCRWFTRGWTLQELLASVTVVFYNAAWKEIGSRLSLQNHISRITGIGKEFLREKANFATCAAATKMSWAAHRQTSRVEDIAYCLMGLFGVTMPLLYGEGNRAFRRLQEEILRLDEDYTILAWGPSAESRFRDESRNVLADTPHDFTTRHIPQIYSFHWPRATQLRRPIGRLGQMESIHLNSLDHLPPSVTGRGVRVTLPVHKGKFHPQYDFVEVARMTSGERGPLTICIPLIRPYTSSEAHRRADLPLAMFPTHDLDKSIQYSTIYMSNRELSRPQHNDQRNDETTFIIVKQDPGLSQYLEEARATMGTLQEYLELHAYSNTAARKQAMNRSGLRFLDTLFKDHSKTRNPILQRYPELLAARSSTHHILNVNMTRGELAKSIAMGDPDFCFITQHEKPVHVFFFKIRTNPQKQLQVVVYLAPVHSVDYRVVSNTAAVDMLDQGDLLHFDHTSYGMHWTNQEIWDASSRTDHKSVYYDDMPMPRFRISIRPVASVSGYANTSRFVLSLDCDADEVEHNIGMVM